MKAIVFRYGKASVKMVPVENGICTLTNCWSVDRQKGHGHKAIQQAVDYADAHNLTLQLVAQRYGKLTYKSMTNAQLVSFYKKYGFKRVDDHLPALMIRRPQPIVEIPTV